MNTTFNLKNIFVTLLFLPLFFFGASCGSATFGLTADSLFLATNDASVFYELKKPEEKHFLPYVLSEISGLAYHADGNLLAVDDETGKVFQYNLSNREIIKSTAFSDPGDYEGVEIVDDKIYVLESDGDIYSFTTTYSKKAKSKKFETDLSRANDTEGLGYDPMKNQLLIACKERAEVKGNDAKGRAIYAFDLDSKKLKKKPIFSITPKKLKKFWESSKAYEYKEEKIKFKPSAIAFHPIEKNYYVLSSVGKLLVVVGINGSIQSTYPISPSILTQPEGLCFAPNGDMYIASEGDEDKGYILKFSMKER